jgi:phosphoribosylformylglycinamidine synthase
MHDSTIDRKYTDLEFDNKYYNLFNTSVAQLEAVCKRLADKKADRCVGGKVAKQQTAGSLQLPLNNGVMALDYNGKNCRSYFDGTFSSCSINRSCCRK